MFKLSIYILLISLISIAQAQDMVVIHATDSETFPKGKLLLSHTQIDLPSQTEITVVFASGGVTKVIGPYKGFIRDPQPNHKPVLINMNHKANTPPKLVEVVAGLSHFLKNKKLIPEKDELLSEEHRGPINSQELWSQELWLVDATNTRKRFYCLAPSSQVVLWRPEKQSHSASLLQIKHKTTGKKAKVVWPAYQRTLEWPNELPVVYGDTYIVEVKPRRGSQSFKKLVLYQLPDNLPTDSHKVVWMAGRGCILQANMLLASLR
jgi:hypothetical protein